MALSPVEQIYGPTILGIAINVMLFGVMTTQAYLYLSTFKNDKKWMRLFVWFIYCADTLNTGFNIAFLYGRLVHGFGNVDAALTANWVFSTDPAMTAIIAFCVQLFFAWRVKLLVANIFLTILIAFCSAVQMLAGVGTAVACGIVPKFIEFHKFSVVVILWLAFAALADVIIALSLVFHLRKQRTGFAATDTLINKLIRMTVQTGGITAVFAVVDLITFLTSPNTGLHLAFNFPLAKLYTNTLLSTLNARATTQGSGPLTPSSALAHAERRGPAMPWRVRENWKSDAIDLDYGAARHAQSKVHMPDAHELDAAGDATSTQVYVSVEEVKQVDVV